MNYQYLFQGHHGEVTFHLRSKSNKNFVGDYLGRLSIPNILTTYMKPSDVMHDLCVNSKSQIELFPS